MSRSDFAVIFDWDGVIIDSEDYHRESWERLAAEEKLRLPEGAFEASFGMRNQQIIPSVFRWAEESEEERIRALGDRKEELYREIVREQGIAPLPGVVNLVQALSEAEIPFAVGSSTPRENIETVMEVIGLAGQFRTIVAAADVSEGKPHPEVFLTAAQRLGYEPARCVVVEDAHVGIEAGRRGGFRVLAVATTHPPESLQEADRCHPNLSTVSIDELGALIGAE